MAEPYIDLAKAEVEQWEQEGPGFLARVGDFILWPAQLAAEALIPEGIQDRVAEAIHLALQTIAVGAERTFSPDDILNRVRSYEKDGRHPLEAADMAAQHYWNYHIGYAAIEGGATGAAGLPGLPVNIPALFGISLRLLEEIATCYGYHVSTVEERDYLLHVLRTGSTGDVKAKVEFLIGLKQIEQILIRVTWKQMNQALARKEISRLSAIAALRQFARTMGFQITKRKALQMVPVVGALVGASFDATFVNDVGRAGYMCYRRRWMQDREPPGDTA